MSNNAEFLDMGASDQSSGVGPPRIVERGETYTHTRYGDVTVTEIWRGTNPVDAARSTDEKGRFIVRYSAQVNGEDVDGLIETLDEFIQKTN